MKKIVYDAGISINAAFNNIMGRRLDKITPEDIRHLQRCAKAFGGTDAILIEYGGWLTMRDSHKLPHIYWINCGVKAGVPADRIHREMSFSIHARAAKVAEQLNAIAYALKAKKRAGVRNLEEGMHPMAPHPLILGADLTPKAISELEKLEE